MAAPVLLARLMNRDLLRALMERTGDGASITVRELAAAAGCPKSTVGNLISGAQLSVAIEVAGRIAARLGVDFLVLFAPAGRATAAHEIRLTPVGAVSA